MYKLLIYALIFLMPSMSMGASNGSLKKERNFISLGNKEYKNGNYKVAVDAYRNALKINPNSQIAEFNLASALVNLSEADYDKKGQSPIDEATKYFKQLTTTNSKNIALKSMYNLGHIAYNNGDYKSSIDYYKSVLRSNPDDDNARKFLRMAQLKLQKENQNQNQEKNKDQEQKNEQEQNKESQENEQQQENNTQQQNTQNQSQQENIDNANAERILKSIENKEKEILMRINQNNINAQKTQREASGRIIEKPW